MIKKLRHKLKKFLANQEQVRIASIVGLLLLVTAIPLTVYVSQSQQDIRQHAAGDTGFKSIKTSGCGEIISAPAVGAASGDFVFQAPIRTAKGWETHKTDGSIIATDDMFEKLWEQFGSDWSSDIHLKLSRVIEEFTISCTLIIQYGGDCKASVVGHGTSKEDMLPQGETTTIHLDPNNGTSSGCDETVLVRAQYQSSPPASYPSVTPFQWPAGINSRWCTDSDGGKVYDQVGVVTNNVDPSKDTQDCDNNGNCTDVDSCSSGALTEYYCQDGLIKSEQFTCPSGCANDWSCQGPLPTGSLPVSSITPIPDTPTPTSISGSGTIQGYKRVEPSGAAVEPAASQQVSVDGGTAITTDPYGFGNLTPGSHTVTVTVPTGYTVKYSVCINVSTCHEDQTQWKDGPTATVTVTSGQYVDLYWHFIPNSTPTPVECRQFDNNRTACEANSAVCRFDTCNSATFCLNKNLVNCAPTPTPTTSSPTGPTVTPTIPSTPTQFTVSMVIPGIGKNGNTSPNFATRDITFSLFDKTGKQVGSDVAGEVSFDGNAFTGTINMGTIVSSDTYTPWVQTRQGIKTAVVSAPLAITAGVTNTLPAVTIILGDINADGKIDMLDYNLLVSCFGAKADTDSCGGKKTDVDLNDDGVVDGIDYNLFLAGLKATKK